MTGLFTAAQLQTLVAAIDRIVPKDDYPSASEAGCLDFLLKLIPMEGQEEFYRTGLYLLDEAARERGGPFSSMTTDQQDEVLRQFEKSEFVDTLARQTIEGYYADPDNGGNKNGIAWKMIGFEVRN